RWAVRAHRSSLEEAPQVTRRGQMAELPQRLRLDLPDALARHVEARPDLFERMVGTLADPEAQAEDLLLARGERRQHAPGLIAQVDRDTRLDLRQHALVLDEVAEVAVLVLADRRLERDRLAADAENAPHLIGRELHTNADLFGGRLAAELLHEEARHAHQLVHRLD